MVNTGTVDVDEVRYRLEVDLCSESGTAVTKSQVEFRAESESVEAQLDVVSVRRLVLNGRELPAVHWENGRILLDDLRPVNLLAVEAEVEYSKDGRGLVQHVDSDGDRYVHTNLHEQDAARVLPCFDGAQRAPFEIAIVAPAGWVCVAGGRLVDRLRDGHAGRWAFAPTASNRGLVLAAGPWATALVPDIGRRTGGVLYARRPLAADLAETPVGRLVAQCSAQHADALGVPDPFPQQPIVFVPEYAQLGGGGAVLMLHESVLAASLDPDELRYVLWISAHEAAHSWFGFLTSSAPEEAWLMEGLATFIGHRAMESLAPERHPWPSFHLLEEAPAHLSDSAPDAAPVVAATDPPLVYSKPAALLRHLRCLVDEQAILNGLRRWLDRHQFAESTTDELVKALSEAAETDLEPWADDWLRTPGINTLELVIDSDGRDVVTTARILQHAAPSSPLLRTHHTGLEVFDLSSGRLHRRDHLDLVVTGPATDVPQLVGRAVPAVAIINSPPTSYVRVRLDERSRQLLATHLGDLPDHARAACWVAARDMVHDGLMSVDELTTWTARHGRAESDTVVADTLTATRPRRGISGAWRTWTSLP